MKIITLIVAVVAMDYCEAQFTFGVGGLTATQNCVDSDSNCNPNNFSRKRRQILEEILTEVEAEESARDMFKIKRSPRARFGNRDFGREKREIANMIESLTEEVLEADAEEKNVERQEKEAEAVPQFGSLSADQNCVGSICIQNNFVRKKREVIASLLQELL